jgi:lipoate-protein ligase A
MAPISCDLFPFLTADGPTNMAADDVLLEYAVATGRPALRFYTWDPPTLSLGYFQAFADRLACLPVVRRQTGGGAIVHHHELTYALALPPGPLQKSVNWACRMHDIIRATLASYGAAAGAACGQEAGRGAFLCFEHHTPGDVLLGDQKIVGSAQRRRAGALLQHGSILLAASPFAPHRRGIRELADIVFPPDRLADDLAGPFSQTTGWTLTPIDWSADLMARRAQIAEDRYRQPAWTERR